MHIAGQLSYIHRDDSVDNYTSRLLCKSSICTNISSSPTIIARDVANSIRYNSNEASERA